MSCRRAPSSRMLFRHEKPARLISPLDRPTDEDMSLGALHCLQSSGSLLEDTMIPFAITSFHEATIGPFPSEPLRRLGSAGNHAALGGSF